MPNEHPPVPDDQGSDEQASGGTMPDHEDPHPATEEAPRRH